VKTIDLAAAFTIQVDGLSPISDDGRIWLRSASVLQVACVTCENVKSQVWLLGGRLCPSYDALASSLSNASWRSIFMYVWYPIPFLADSLRARSISLTGRRIFTFLAADFSGS